MPDPLKMAGDVGAAAAEEARDAAAAMAKGMKSLAGTIRENMPHEGVLGTASTSIAESLESGGSYLQNQGLDGIAKDMAGIVRRNPIPAILLAAGVGFLVAKVLTRSDGHGK